MEEKKKIVNKELNIPVIEEREWVEKRQVEKGKVRIYKDVTVEEATIDTPLIHENIEVERIPVNQYVEKPPEVRQDGEILIIPVVEEVVVKRLILKEEIHVTKRKEEVTYKEKVRIRREDVKVERE